MTDSRSALHEWVGRSETHMDVAAAAPLARLEALLDRDGGLSDGDAVPPGGHWLFFLGATRQSDLGEDGHARLGGFLPPVGLPWRMWAGGRLRFLQPIHVGERLQRTSEIVDISEKTGRQGALVFVLVRHRIAGEHGLAIEEEHDIVYRGSIGGSTVGEKARAAAWSRELCPDPVLLFCYSALTFNGHRIHYDADYCRKIGYPGLVVHGPLIATLLLDLIRRKQPEARVRRFAFRAVRPLFAGNRMSVNAAPRDNGGLELWAADEEGLIAMQAQAELTNG